jgi:hypothetical protein
MLVFPSHVLWCLQSGHFSLLLNLYINEGEDQGRGYKGKDKGCGDTHTAEKTIITRNKHWRKIHYRSHTSYFIRETHIIVEDGIRMGIYMNSRYTYQQHHEKSDQLPQCIVLIASIFP